MERRDALDQFTGNLLVGVAHAGFVEQTVRGQCQMKTLLVHSQDPLVFGDAGGKRHFVDGLDRNIDFSDAGPRLNDTVTDFAVGTPLGPRTLFAPEAQRRYVNIVVKTVLVESQHSRSSAISALNDVNTIKARCELRTRKSWLEPVAFGNISANSGAQWRTG